VGNEKCALNAPVGNEICAFNGPVGNVHLPASPLPCLANHTVQLLLL
jgi:hypothetical protein